MGACAQAHCSWARMTPSGACKAVLWSGALRELLKLPERAALRSLDCTVNWKGASLKHAPLADFEALIQSQEGRLGTP